MLYFRNSDPRPVPASGARYASSVRPGAARSAPTRSAAAQFRPGRRDRGTGRWGWWGLAFVAGFIASIVAGNAFTVGPGLYLPGASAAQLRDFYGTNATAVVVQSVLQVAAVALLLFGYGLRAAVRPAAGNRASVLTGVGTVVAAGALAASVVCSVVLIPLARSGSETALAGVGRAALVLGGAVHLLGSGVLMVAASVTALRVGVSSRWVFHYGRVAGVLVSLSALSAVVPPLVRPEPAFGSSRPYGLWVWRSGPCAAGWWPTGGPGR